jgi:ribosomal protein S18 acetylase RimI-like enzyme
VATLRRAVPADAPALARLRALMHEAMGTPASDPAYLRASEQAFGRRLRDDPGFVAYVVVDGDGSSTDAATADGDGLLGAGSGTDGTVLACGVGHLEEHLPSPTQLDGRRGHVSSMSTDPAARRQGHARAVLSALMDWMTEQGVARVDLRATPDGQPLYESLGFRVLGGATMSWTAPGVRPGMPRA